MELIEDSNEEFIANYRNGQSFSKLDSKPRWKPFRENVMIKRDDFVGAINLPRQNRGEAETPKIASIHDFIKLCESISNDFYYTEQLDPANDDSDLTSYFRNGVVMKVIERLETRLNFSEMNLFRKTTLLDITPLDKDVKDWKIVDVLAEQNDDTKAISSYNNRMIFDISIDIARGSMRIVTNKVPIRAIY